MAKKQSWKRHVVLAFTIFDLCSCTKHTFTTRKDARHVIGPIGAPFGFLTGGIYNLTVFDFELSIRKPSMQSDIYDGRGALRYTEAGFLLKRFESDSDFSTYFETIIEQPTLCVYESHRSKDFVSMDPSNTDDDKLESDDKFQVNYEGDGDHHLDSVGTNGLFLSMNQPEKTWKPHTALVTYSFTNLQDEGLYFLIFQLCPRDTKHKDIEVLTSFELDLHFMNFDSFGNPSYLTAGEMMLPGMFLYFSISYALCFFLWASNIRKIRLGQDPMWTTRGGGTSRPSVHAIHHLMTLLLGLKTITVFFEALRYFFIRIHGHAEFLSAVYYVMSFVKGIFMFTVILLIGSGWSLIKPVLGDREKKIIWVVLVLQVIDNIAVAVLAQETEGEKLYDDWNALLHLVDILCCCAILIPIVWQVNSLEVIVEGKTESQNSSNEGRSEKIKTNAITEIESEVPASAEAARTLQKLKQFQRFYILVVAYIYFTRIVVYLFATMLGYRLTWLRYFVTELGTLVFYLVVGILFRPMEDNPYLVARGTDDAEEIEFVQT
jgi:NADH:ubiquinone oxidoreductase subunit 3 (subunit A)